MVRRGVCVCGGVSLLFYKNRQDALSTEKQPSTQLARAAVDAQNVCFRQSNN